MARRIVAIAFILVFTSIAWAVLGGTIFSRTYNAGPGLRAKVESPWGSPQKQRPPAATYSFRVTVKNESDAADKNAAKAQDQVITGTLPLDSSHIDVSLHLDHRQKGLLWYSTYSADFSGAYTFRNDTEQPRCVTISWPFLAEKAVYDNLSLALDGRPLEFKNDNSQATAIVPFAAGETHALTVSYRLSALGGGNALRSTRCRHRAAHLPGAVFLRLLLQGIHGPGGDHRRHPDAVRRDADDRPLQLERATPENESSGDGLRATSDRSGSRR